MRYDSVLSLLLTFFLFSLGLALFLPSVKRQSLEELKKPAPGFHDIAWK